MVVLILLKRVRLPFPTGPVCLIAAPGTFRWCGFFLQISLR
jgi:hypothetical protein